MKQLEIKTNKRLLIVEFDDMDHLENVLSCDKQGIRVCTDNDEPTKFICKGSDLTEDIANGFTHSMNFGTDENPDIGYHHSIKDNYCCGSALESFISAIQSKNYHWGENPVSLEREKIYRNMGDTFKADGILKAWRESESRTFNPSKCIIFEII
ncbi:hypothetical protein KBP46_10010 [Chryseobacterium sp. PCH239]|uniref:hypothetical protein n=1 Tax=Chryseobacterium sp. PCH239 TaxID=2825845 RepID=UPI001C10D9C1|nr:hypothetical protein [Chryseobacterium sp. PCH239]QWT88130.1 hypothetical protein KBP46_10010 [Chryseobacterium sp. PCH239]